ncbi:hypothetical protein NB713_001132 [Xanthomonas sacchari]|nr:hypothetical protein [Xanthomonas sacchari]
MFHGYSHNSALVRMGYELSTSKRIVIEMQFAASKSLNFVNFVSLKDVDPELLQQIIEKLDRTGITLT